MYNVKLKIIEKLTHLSTKRSNNYVVFELL